jgi:hypothetical protein
MNTPTPTHAERMQAIIDLAFDAENALDDNDTVQIKVVELAEFVRHYWALYEALIEQELEALSHASVLQYRGSKIERLLKGKL